MILGVGNKYLSSTIPTDVVVVIIISSSSSTGIGSMNSSYTGNIYGCMGIGRHLYGPNSNLIRG
jgi:hypothetical protein